MLRRLLVTGLAIGVATGAMGCRHRCCKSSNPVPNPFLPPPPGGSMTIPPPGVPTSPSAFPPPASAGAFPPPTARGSMPPEPILGGPTPGMPPSNFGPPATKPAPEVLFPDPIPSGSSSSSRSNASPGTAGVLGEPAGPTAQSPEPPLALKPAPATSGNGFPPPADPSAPATKAPVQASRFPGLPGFVVVKDGVASGRVPNAEGFDMLQKSGYRTVVYLHAEGADTATLQADAEKRGLTFTAIETTPARLASSVDAFNRVVGTPASRPVYICDDDGLRAGVLWYVHFRTVEVLNADAASVRARPLGYTDEGDDAKTFQLAVQQYFATR